MLPNRMFCYVFILLSLIIFPHNLFAQSQIYYSNNRASFGPAGLAHADLDGGNANYILDILRAESFEIDLQNKKIYKLYAGNIQRIDFDGKNPQDLLSNLQYAYLMKVDFINKKMYWKESGAIKRANIDGSEKETVVDSTSIHHYQLDPAHGKIYWNTYTGDTIFRANLDGQMAETAATGLSSTGSFAFDPVAGKIYWSDTVRDEIRRINTDGTTLQTVISGVQTVVLEIDAVNQKLYFIHDNDDRILRANTDGSNLEELGFADYDSGELKVVPELGKIYYIDRSHSIVTAEIDGGSPGSIGSGMASITYMSVDFSKSKIYWCDTAKYSLFRANFDGSRIERLASNIDNPWNCSIDFQNGKVYWYNGRDKMRRANLDGSAIEEILSVGIVYSIFIDTKNAFIYYTSSGGIYRANLDGSAKFKVITDNFIPSGMSLDLAGGKIYWRSSQGIKRANIDGTGVETLATFTSYYNYLLDLDLDAGKIYWDLGGLNRANLDGSGQEKVSLDLNSPDDLTDLEIIPDKCLADPLKLTPGDCGCGVKDEDLDQNGIADCIPTPTPTFTATTTPTKIPTVVPSAIPTPLPTAQQTIAVAATATPIPVIMPDAASLKKAVKAAKSIRGSKNDKLVYRDYLKSLAAGLKLAPGRATYNTSVKKLFAETEVLMHSFLSTAESLRNASTVIKKEKLKIKLKTIKLKLLTALESAQEVF